MLADVAAIMDFKQGLLDADEVIELFQSLINSGMAWELQESYGRMADRLITAGKCTRSESGVL
jgi:hypothetical protein